MQSTNISKKIVAISIATAILLVTAVAAETHSEQIARSSWGKVARSSWGK
jgi:hypothetical protein